MISSTSTYSCQFLHYYIELTLKLAAIASIYRNSTIMTYLAPTAYIITEPKI